MSTTLRTLTTLSVCAAAALFPAGAMAQESSPETHAGRASVYRNLQESSLERVTPSERILAVTRGRVAPTEIWRALEHGEKVECLSCIPAVSKLLFDGHAKTREISAWWLRRRIFGVFGAGQIYSQVVQTLSSDASEVRRARAAEALGEFLVGTGVPLVAKAAVTDSSPLVRVSAVRALERLNNEGPLGELGTAIADAAPEVRLAALRASVRVNSFSGVDSVIGRLSDESPEVRRSAAEVLGSFRSSDAVVGLIALTSPEQEADARVRGAAVAALGRIADPSARDAVEAAQSDPDALVRSLSRIALRRL